MMTDDMADAAAKTMEDFKAAGGDGSYVEVITNPQEAERVREQARGHLELLRDCRYPA